MIRWTPIRQGGQHGCPMQERQARKCARHHAKSGYELRLIAGTTPYVTSRHRRQMHVTRLRERLLARCAAAGIPWRVEMSDGNELRLQWGSLPRKRQVGLW